MRRCFLLTMLLFLPIVLGAQVLLETADGDELLQNPLGITHSNMLGNFNVSEQSAQFKAIFVLPNSKGILPDRYFSVGLKGKPSNGISTLFSGGKLNAGTNINVAYTKINLFSGTMSNFTDYFTLKAEYNLSKYAVFNPDDDFRDQLKHVDFQGGGASLNYNNLVAGKNMFTLSIGYLYKNNYWLLEPVEVRDFKSVYDEDTKTSREYGKVLNGRMGDFRKYGSMPFHLGYTLTPSEHRDDQEKIKFGFSAYYLGEFGDFKTSHQLGSVFFLTKQNADTGVRIPIVGLGVQVNDITGNIHPDKKFGERVVFNLTTAFNVAGF